MFGFREKTHTNFINTGQNNHNWQVSHLAIQQTLENSGLFKVDFAISPEKGKDMSGFVLDFAPYVWLYWTIMVICGRRRTKTRFVDFVKNGGE